MWVLFLVYMILLAFAVRPVIENLRNGESFLEAINDHRNFWILALMAIYGLIIEIGILL